MQASKEPPPPDAINRVGLGSRLREVAGRFVGNNWKVVLYVLLIVLCVLFAPEAPLKFIYTEF